MIPSLTKCKKTCKKAAKMLNFATETSWSLHSRVTIKLFRGIVKLVLDYASTTIFILKYLEEMIKILTVAFPR